MGGKIVGMLISIGLIIGGLSETMVLRGTNSSSALVLVGFGFLVWDIISIATHKNPNATAVCAKCHSTIEYAAGGALAAQCGIKGNTVVCGKCGSAYAMKVLFSEMTLAEDISQQHQDALAPVLEQIKNDGENAPKSQAKACPECGESVKGSAMCPICGTWVA